MPSPVQQAKIAYGDPYWHEFNGSFQNVEQTQMAIASALYDGHPITTWHSNHWRHSKNYQCGQHLGLDFDTKDQRSTIPTLLKEPFIARHGSIVYTTLSHTPDEPRARVIFLLDTPIMQPRNYALAAAALLWMFGTADRQCKDPARFFFGGRPGACEMEWLGRELSLAIVKDAIKRYQETGLRQRQKVQRQYASQGPDEARVIDALKHIDAWGVDYDQWVAILMAIHSEFPGDNGLNIAESWGDGKAGEVAQKWKSFHSDGGVTGRVGIGTLFGMAKERGWQA